MLDTVILNIPRGKYKINPNMFTPNADILRGPGNFLVKCVSNPSAEDKRNNIYRPRLTMVKRMTRNGIELPLKIEFSATKILFNNNVNEVQDSDFENEVRTLAEQVEIMGAQVAPEVLANTNPSAFHPSKNFELTDGYTSRFVIKEIQKVNANKKFDMDHKGFKNNGQVFQFYTNSHSFVMYDKTRDQRKGKRAIDKDQNYIQLSLFDTLRKEKKEILRMEVRLAKKVKMNEVLKKLGYKPNPTFRDIFNRELCQKILKDYWQELVMSENLFLFDIESKALPTLEKVFKNKPKIKPKEAIYLAGLRTLSREGIRDTRAVIEQYASTRTWYRIADDLPFLDELSDKMYHGWIKQINDSLDTFQPYKLSTSDQLAM